MDDVLTLLLRELLKGMEISLVVFHDDLIDHQFLHVIRCLLTNVDKEDKSFEEVLLLTEIVLILLMGNLEGVHGDWPFLGIGDVGTMIVTADTFVGVTCINQYNIGVLYEQLANHAVHMKRLAAATWADAQEVGIVGMFDLSLLASEVNTDGQSVAVGVIYQQWRKLRLLGMLLEKETDGSIGECQEQVIVWIEGIGITGK